MCNSQSLSLVKSVMQSYKNVYITAITVTIALIVFNQIFIQYFLHQKRNDAYIINLSGRQRMLSQRLMSQVYQHQYLQKEKAVSQINATFTEWERVHNELITSDLARVASYDQADSIERDLEGITPQVERAKAIVAKLNQLDSLQLQSLHDNQEVFLTKMNRVVARWEDASNRKLRFIIIIEILFALLSLAVLFFEIQFVFRRITRRLVAQNDELRLSNALLEQYAYLASHDLRAPTQNVINFANLLDRTATDRLTEDEQQYLGFVLDSANRMKATTDDLLRFAQVNREKIKLAACFPRTIVDQVLADLTTEIEQRQAIVTIGELPPSIIADAHLLRNVFQNLIANGLKFVAKGVTPIIEIMGVEKKEEYVFSIKDNGIGIRSEHQEKIFTIFTRLNAREQFQGTGIGLSLCQKIVEKHSGRIWVTSEVGLGSQFSFSISKSLK